MIKMAHFGYVKEQRKKERKGFVKRCYWPEKSSGVMKIVAGFWVTHSYRWRRKQEKGVNRAVNCCKYGINISTLIFLKNLY